MYKISILMYHQVGKFARPAAHRATFCHVRRFRAQMACLKFLRYQVLSLPDVMAVLSGKRNFSGHAVALTFDDGYQNFHDYAFPVLQRFGFPATVFLVSELIGDRAQWLADDGRLAPPMMELGSIRKLRNENVLFGSHTRTHPRLNELDGVRLKREIEGSKQDLEKFLEEEIPFFCYPNGIYTDAAVGAVREAGYQAALTCDRGSVMPEENPLLLPRKAISFGDSLAGFFWKLHMKHKKKRQPAPA